MTENYYIIQKYKNIIPDFPLYFKISKYKKCFYKIYPKYKYDLFQIICLCYFSTKTLKEFNLMLGREIYYFTTKVSNHYIIKSKTKINYYKKNNKPYPKAKKSFVCDICNKEKLEYKRKHYNKIICGACRRKVERLEKKGIFI